MESQISETIPGGAYLSADGKTWHDANGQPLSDDAMAELERRGLIESKKSSKKTEKDRTSPDSAASSDKKE